MKPVLWLGLITFLAGAAVAQHAGGPGAGGRGGPGRGGLPPGRHGGFGRIRGGFANPFYPPGYPGFYPYAYPLLSGYDTEPAYQYPYQPAPNVIVIQQPAPELPPPPPPPVRSVTHTYAVSATSQPALPQTFTIALKDGSRLSASIVWVQDRFVHYADSEGRFHQIPLESVDRNLTTKLNESENLKLRLPPPE